VVRASNGLIQKLQSTQNAPARVIRRCDHITHCATSVALASRPATNGWRSCVSSAKVRHRQTSLMTSTLSPSAAAAFSDRQPTGRLLPRHERRRHGRRIP